MRINYTDFWFARMIFGSPEHKYSENYCHSPGLVVVVVVICRQKLKPYFSYTHTTIDSCYLNLVATGELCCLLTTLVMNSHFFNHTFYFPSSGFVAHEFILDCREFKKVQIEVMDIAKRLQDYGKHCEIPQCLAGV